MMREVDVYMTRLNKEIVEKDKLIAQLNELVDMLIDSQSADQTLIPIMYHAWLDKAKNLREQK